MTLVAAGADPTRSGAAELRCSATPSAPTSTVPSPAFPDREALVDVPSRAALDVRGIRPAVDEVARGAARQGRRQGRPGRHLGRQLPEWVLSSTPPPASARSWSTSTRPTGRTSWVTSSGSPGSPARPRPDHRTSDYRAMVEQVRGQMPGAARRASTSVTRAGTGCWPPAPAVTAAQLVAARGRAVLRRPDQHPVHLGYHRLPQGRHPLPPQHPQQRLSRGRDGRLHRGRTGSACRCPSTTASAWSWETSAPPRTAPASSSPRARLRRRRTPCARSRTSAAPRSTASRPCSSRS